jgi:hypothetical protein
MRIEAPELAHSKSLATHPTSSPERSDDAATRLRAASGSVAPRRLVVLDCETAPCLEAAALAKAVNGISPGALHRLVAISLLKCELDDAGRPTSLRMDALTGTIASDRDLLAALDALMPPLDGHTMLITFNGRSWDLPMLRLRAAATWSFGLRNLPSWWAAESTAHMDLMCELAPGEASRWPSLRDATAALGIDLGAARGRQAGSGMQATSRRCTADVCATFLLYLFLKAADRSDPLILAAGWSGLSDLILGDRKLERIRYFALHEVVPSLRTLASSCAPRG